LQELKTNKLRTALSLTGIAFGIFCIIGVFATVNSLEINIQNEVKNLGTNTIYIDKWNYVGGTDRPIWKYRIRPVMKYDETTLIKERSQLLQDAAYVTRTSEDISNHDIVIQNAGTYGIIESQSTIQPISFETGRYISSAEFNSGSAVGLIGFDNAEKLFGDADRALGQQFEIKGKKVTIVGVIKKEGKDFIGWDYDDCIMIPYNFCKTIININNANPVIIAKGKEGVNAGSALHKKIIFH